MEPPMNAAKSRRSKAIHAERARNRNDEKILVYPEMTFDLLGVHPPFSAVNKSFKSWNRR